MGMVKEFEEFALKGNVVDLAVGVVIGGAFGKIVSALVADILMPPVGLLIGGFNFNELKIQLKDPVLDTAGKVAHEAVALDIGNFLQTLLDFGLTALAMFLVVKVINRLHRQAAEVPVPSRQEKLLAEIRDLLKKKR